jgi:hypothetical protein
MSAKNSGRRSSSPSAKIIRCRLIKTGDPIPDMPQGNFTEVWDSLDKPFESIGKLPRGQLISCEQDFSYAIVRAKTDAHRLRMRGMKAYTD